MRIYYTGDIANNRGWFSATESRAGILELAEEAGGEDRYFAISSRGVGNVYRGHCNPRFVTEEAYNAFFAQERAGVPECKVGTRVTTSGYPGVITRVCEWTTDLVEVRLASGYTVCVDIHDCRAEVSQ